MAPKKTNVKLNVKAESVEVVKATVRAAKPSAKSIVKKSEEIAPASVKKMVEYQRVQTAEGWNRMKKREMLKK